MIDRYRTLYTQLKLIEYQLKQRAKESSGRNAAFKIKGGRRGFVKPEVFSEIIERKKK